MEVIAHSLKFGYCKAIIVQTDLLSVEILEDTGS